MKVLEEEGNRERDFSVGWSGMGDRKPLEKGAIKTRSRQKGGQTWCHQRHSLTWHSK